MSNPNETSLVQLHIAEYQALTTRGSYWIVLQVGLLPVVPIYLALATQVWQAGVIRKEVVIWATLAGLLMVGLVWANTVIEQYVVVRYIECYLRPMTKQVVRDDAFWGYEPHLIRNRVTPQILAEPAVAAFGSALFIITCITRCWWHSWLSISTWDICGAMINTVVLILIWRQTLKAGKIRREWSAFDSTLAKSIEEIRKTGGTLSTE